MVSESAVTLSVNGQTYDLVLEPRITLADALRDRCGLTGTHLGCEHGVCGACTVLIDGEPVRSCLLFAVQAEGHDVLTVEGLAGDEELHPIQRAFLAHDAFQCGFCTPGFLMLSVAALTQNPQIGHEELREVLSSNLCRCTGYGAIVAAVTSCQEHGR
jgi:aerobic carbon-monoxide dehydrogenase small subunit